MEIKIADAEFRAELEAAAKQMLTEGLEVLNVPGSSGCQLIRAGSAEHEQVLLEMENGELVLPVPVTLEGKDWVVIF